MTVKNLLVEAPDTLKYNYTVRKKPSPEGFSGHSHNAYELLYFINGDATYAVEDKKYKLREGDLIITRPSKYHFIQMDSDKDYERHNILFDHKKLGIDMRHLPEEIDVINVKGEKIITDILDKFSYYAASFSCEDFVRVARLLVEEIIFNIPLIEKNRESDFLVINPILSKALSYIGENLYTIRDISEVADAVFVTESYLYRLFKRELFKSPKKYITEKRLLLAQNGLKKGKRPTEVAAECGFEDYTTFYRNYTELFGKSPSEERSL